MSSTARDSGAPRKAAVLGSPIAHSRSPQLHLAAYRALGLQSWTYDRIECDADELPTVVGGFGPEWVGVSVTMPAKFAALAFADERTERAELVGSANTLVRSTAGWLADNTDVDGITGALGAVSGRAVVLGSGGTAPAAVVALAATLGVPAGFCGLDDAALAGVIAAAGVLISTVPAEVAERYAPTLAGVPVLLDAVYHPWPTPLAAAVGAAGGTVISGLQMLLHQACTQVELFTGLPAPRQAMTCALAELD